MFPWLALIALIFLFSAGLFGAYCIGFYDGAKEERLSARREQAYSHQLLQTRGEVEMVHGVEGSMQSAEKEYIGQRGLN